MNARHKVLCLCLLAAYTYYLQFMGLHYINLVITGILSPKIPLFICFLCYNHVTYSIARIISANSGLVSVAEVSYF